MKRVLNISFFVDPRFKGNFTENLVTVKTCMDESVTLAPEDPPHTERLQQPPHNVTTMEKERGGAAPPSPRRKAQIYLHCCSKSPMQDRAEQKQQIHLHRHKKRSILRGNCTCPGLQGVLTLNHWFGGMHMWNILFIYIYINIYI